MQYPSIFVLFYFLPALLLLYFACSFSRALQNLCLLAASLLFYSWGEPATILFLILSVLVNWFLGGLVNHLRASSGKGARLVTAAAVAFNLGGLFFYVYLGPLLAYLNSIVGRELLTLEARAVPLGISFFTLQAISYVVDVYRGEAKAEQWPLGVGLYISLFPLLTAGPIVRYADIAGQLHGRRATWSLFADGCVRFVGGLAKTTLLLPPMKAIADHAFDLSASGNQVYVVPAMLAWLGLVAFTLQIYFYFSGYAEMATGLAGMFGFSIRENFAYPYISRSVNEFWQRWQLSLVGWFRTYFPLSLGGLDSESSEGWNMGKSYFRGMFAAWVLLGLWHGVGWSFVVWGIWHCLFLIFESAALLPRRNIIRPLGHTYLILVVMVGWVFYRSPDVYNATIYLSNMLGLNANGYWSDLALVLLRENWVYLLLGGLFSLPAGRWLSEMANPREYGVFGVVCSVVFPVFLLAVYAVSVLYLARACFVAGYTF